MSDPNEYEHPHPWRCNRCQRPIKTKDRGRFCTTCEGELADAYAKYEAEAMKHHTKLEEYHEWLKGR